MLNEHPLKIRVNTLNDMFKQIGIIGKDFLLKNVDLIRTDEYYNNYVHYGRETEKNWQINRRLEYFNWVCKNYGIEIFVWRTGEIVVTETKWNKDKSEYISKINHLGKFFTKKQMQELKNYMIQEYDKKDESNISTITKLVREGINI